MSEPDKKLTELGTAFVGAPSQCCKRCGHPMTWDAQKRQFSRLSQLGWVRERIKEATPRCQKCVTQLLREQR